ncbi:hypothetical protein [Aeromonas sp. HMWF016]|uniref:hypothetical protein n=1 Tax=Aeromonas sp. HMWF016 TaxID=2056852 RepID=UPI0011B214D5|nr:hypothetical protein [Aeromonas sp. HMWF016]
MNFNKICCMAALLFISINSYAIEDKNICNSPEEFGIMDWLVTGGDKGDVYIVMEKDYPLEAPLGRFKRYVPEKYERVKDLITQAYLLSYSVCFDEMPQDNGQKAIVAIYIKAS